MMERQKGVESWQKEIEEILAQEVAQRAEALKAEMVREIEEKESGGRRSRTSSKDCSGLAGQKGARGGHEPRLGRGNAEAPTSGSG